MHHAIFGVVLGITTSIVGLHFDSWEFWVVIIPTVIAHHACGAN